MVRKDNSENIEPSEALEISEVIEPADNFDISVLKNDIENAEKEAKEAVQDRLIKQADFQKESENLQVETEKVQDFKETLTELLEMVFTPINKSFEKKDISKLDNEFIDKLIDKLMKLIPKEKLHIVEKFIGAGGNAGSSLQILRIFRFISFMFKEIYNRFDEWQVYSKAHDTGKQKKLMNKESE